MKRPTAILAEDEAAQRQALVRLLGEEWPDLAIVAQCEDGLSTLEALQTHEPAIAFLDIRMPGLSGLQVAAHSGRNTTITTAYSEHAVKAFEQGAVDYLMKPVSRERLRIALERVRQRIGSGGTGDALGGERYELELTGTTERVPVSVAFKGRFRGM